MAYCDTCGGGYSQEQIQRRENISKAIKYAKENCTEVAVFKEGNEWKYGTVAYLQSAGIPFREVYNEHSRLPG